jgi:hypothetical protein
VSSLQPAKIWAGIGITAVAIGFAYYVSAHPMDFRVYHYGARGVFDGTRPVYGPDSGLGWPMHYRYPPLFLLLVAPFAMLPLGWGAGLWVVLKVAVLGLLARAFSAAHSLAPAGLLLAFLFIAPYIVEEFRYGNVQFFVFALAAAGLWMARKRPVLSGASLALAIAIKVWPLFFIPYLAARQDWKVVASALCFAAALTLTPALFFGFGQQMDLMEQWLAQESATQFSDSEIWFPNQSLRGVLMRYLTEVDYSRVPDSNYPQVHVAAIDPAVVRNVWMAAAAAVYAGFLLLAYRRRASSGWIEHGLAFCLVALLQPFTQKYALAVLLWPAVVAMGLAVRPAARLLLYAATALVLIQPLAAGANAQRLLQVLGVDFAATLLLAAVLMVALAQAGIGPIKAVES